MQYQLRGENELKRRLPKGIKAENNQREGPVHEGVELCAAREASAAGDGVCSHCRRHPTPHSNRHPLRELANVEATRGDAWLCLLL